MKKYLMIMAALSMLLTQCRKAELQQPTEVYQEIKISITAGTNLTRTDINVNTGFVTWNEDDRVYVIHNGKALNGCLYARNTNENIAKIEGTVSGTSFDLTKPFYYIYAGDGVNVDRINDGTTFKFGIIDQTAGLDVGEYMICTTPGVMMKEEGGVYVHVLSDYIPFTPYTSVVRVNTNTLSGNIEFTGDNAHNRVTFTEPSSGTTLSANLTKGSISFIGGSDTNVSVLPSNTADGVVEDFGLYKENKIGVVGIKSGIKSARVYVKLINGYPTPINIEVDDYVIHTTDVQGVHSTCASTGGMTVGCEFDYEGVCWSTNHNPVIDDNPNVYVFNQKDSQGKYIKKEGQSPAFTAFVDGLAPSSTYYVRAFLKKAGKVIYGEEKTITTKASENVQYVDVGTDVLWAKWNLGSESDYEPGDYYMWGDIACCTNVSSGDNLYPSSHYWRNYRFSNTDVNMEQSVNDNKLVKYCDDVNFWYDPSGTPDGKRILDDVDDAVRRTLKDGESRMPNYSDWQEMIAKIKTTSIVFKSSTEAVLKVTYNNGAVLYFPAGGYRYGDTFLSADYTGDDGSFFLTWLGDMKPGEDCINGGYCRMKAKKGSTWVDPSMRANWRTDALNIRPVKDATTSSFEAPNF